MSNTMDINSDLGDEFYDWLNDHWNDYPDMLDEDGNMDEYAPSKLWQVFLAQRITAGLYVPQHLLETQ